LLERDEDEDTNIGIVVCMGGLRRVLAMIMAVKTGTLFEILPLDIQIDTGSLTETRNPRERRMRLEN